METTKTSMTSKEHKKRHKLLHKYLDELFADYIKHHPDEITFTEMPIIKLMKWSYSQTNEPTEIQGR